MSGAANWRWRDADRLFEAWGHDPQLDQALASIADTPTNRLAGSTILTGARGGPLAILRRVEIGALRIVFSVALGYDDNWLAVVHLSRS